MRTAAFILIVIILAAAPAAPVTGQAAPRAYLPMLAKRAALIQDPPGYHTPTPAPPDW